MKKILYTLALTVICNSVANAQVSHSLYTLESIPQSTVLNPARQPRSNFYVAIPAVNQYYQVSTNLRPRRFFQRADNEWITPIDSKFNYKRLSKYYRKKLAVDMTATINVVDFGWRLTDESYLTFSINERINTDIQIPSGLMLLADKGLPHGSLLELGRLGVNAKAYHEFNASFSYVYDDQWTFGARAKYLVGIGAVKTKNRKFDIETNRDIWHFRTNVELMTSMPLETAEAIRDNGTVAFDSIDFRELKGKDLKKFIAPGLKNPGMGLDLGANFVLDENFKFSASVTDLGFIIWNNDIHNFKTKSEFDFDGIEVDMKRINENEDEEYKDYLEDELDSLEIKLNTTLNHRHFVTGLNPNIYLCAEYTPNHYLTVSFLSHTKFFPRRAIQDFNVSATVNPYKPFSAIMGMTLTTLGKTSANLGFSVRGGVLQFYAIADYIPFRYNKYNIQDESFTLPRNMTNFNVSFGLNVLLGPHGYRDKPMINAYTDF